MEDISSEAYARQSWSSLVLGDLEGVKGSESERKIFFFKRPGQIPACINQEEAVYMINLLRKILNRWSMRKLPTEKKAKEIIRYLGSQLKQPDFAPA